MTETTNNNAQAEERGFLDRTLRWAWNNRTFCILVVVTIGALVAFLLGKTALEESGGLAGFLWTLFFGKRQKDGEAILKNANTVPSEWHLPIGQRDEESGVMYHEVKEVTVKGGAIVVEDEKGNTIKKDLPGHVKASDIKQAVAVSVTVEAAEGKADALPKAPNVKETLDKVDNVLKELGIS